MPYITHLKEGVLRRILINPNLSHPKVLTDTGNDKYIPIIEFGNLDKFLNWNLINSTFDISKLIIISTDISAKGKLFSVYAPFMTPYFNKNSILIVSTNLNNENIALNLYIGYSEELSNYYILKKEKGEFFAYLTQNNNCITKLKLVAVITNIILETKK